MNNWVGQRIIRCLSLSILGAGFMLQPLLSQARAVAPDAAAPSSQQPTLDTAPNGAALINIVRPNDKGLSHNKYQQFNVTAKGLIFNNSTEISRSRLGGVISYNPNLRNLDRTATLILNEVTGANRSRLEGFLEVHGQRAAVVIANPYGITCNGCGFINTPRATLTTGIPNIQNGQLRHFDVNQGEVSIEGSGLNAANIDHFDIVSRTAKLNAALHAKNLNIITGRNVVNYASREINKKTQEEQESPAVAIDSSALGGMYADRIELIGTDAGVGVNLRGTLVASQGDLRLSAEGKIALKNTAAEGNIAITSKQSGIDTGSISTKNDITLSAKTVIEVAPAERILAENNITITSHSLTNTGTLSAGKNLNVTAKGRIENEKSARIGSNQNTIIKAAGLTNDGTLSALGQTDVNVGGALENTGTLGAGKNLNVTAKGRIENEKSARIGSNQNTIIKAAGLTNDGTLSALGQTDVNVGGALENTGTLSAGKNLNVTAKGRIENEKLARSGVIKILSSRPLV